MKSYKAFTEGTIQPNGTDKIDPACGDVATKKKTDKEMKDQQNESWTFDTAAMAKQELADAKNKKHRKRGKVANLLRKLGMKEEVESLDETGGPLGYMGSAEARKREAARRKKQLQSNETPAQKKFLDKATKLNKEDKEETMSIKPKSLREFVETLAEAKPVNVNKVNAAGEEPHEEKWEDAKKPAVKKESFTAEELLVALKEGMWPGTPEYNAKFGNQAKQGGGAGVKKGSRYGGSLQKPEKEDDNDADDKAAKKAKNK